MKLTVKDKDFLEKLKRLLDEKELNICLKEDGVKRFVLRQNYGDKIEKPFGMTRQGVRWRFHHLMEMYLGAVEVLYFLETNFGTELRPMAFEVAKERIAMRKKASSRGIYDDYRRQTEQEESPSHQLEK